MVEVSLIYVFIGYAGGMQKFLGQGLNPHPSSDLSRADNARFLTMRPLGNYSSS